MFTLLGTPDTWAISIHALLAESDLIDLVDSPIAKISIHALLAESDDKDQVIKCLAHISIHALLAESDPRSWRLRPKTRYFYPRSPCGERRPCHGRVHQSRDYFYPRSPCGERHVACGYWHKLQHFYPRSPCGERLRRSTMADFDKIFLSTLSLRRATRSNQTIVS